MRSIIPVIRAFAPETHLLQIAWQPLPNAQPTAAAYSNLLRHITTHPVCRVLLDLRQQKPFGVEAAQQWVARELLPCLLSCHTAPPPPRIACVPPLAYYRQLRAEAVELVNQSELLTLRYFLGCAPALRWLGQEAAA